jgi:hypothetical protein
MRKIIIDPDDFVDGFVDGILAAQPHMLPGAVADLRFLEALQRPSQ